MDNETQKIFEEQLLKLPQEVVAFLSTASWNDELDSISSLYNLNDDQTTNLKREVALVLAGLVHPNAISSNLEQEAGINGAVLEAVVAAVEKKIFASVRTALVDFVEKEEAAIDATPATPEEAAVPTEPAPNVAPKPVGAPENLPVAPEPEHLIPPIPPKMEAVFAPVPPQAEEMGHPFEEKMKQVFTSGQPAADDLVLKPAAPTAMADTFVSPPTPAPQETPKAAPSRLADPYREPIE